MKKYAIYLIFFALMLSLCSCIRLESTVPDGSNETVEGEKNDQPIAMDYLMLVNKEHSVEGEVCSDSNLVKVPPSLTPEGKEVLLERKTAEAVERMLADMKNDGISDLMITSGYRSYAYQAKLFEGYLKKEMCSASFTEDAFWYFGRAYIWDNYTSRGIDTLTYEDALKVVLSYSAYPGTSEHQTGLCLDFITAQMTALDTSFEETSAFEWLSKNAYRYGFILRYPKDKTEITGYSYEPWHYRYVGVDAAAAIWKNNLTLEEYLEMP